MSRHAIVWALGLLLVVAGCRRYSLTLEVQPPEGASLDELQLSATLYAPGASSGVDCERIAFGDFAEDDLLASLVGHAQLEGETGELGQIPRMGQKIVVVRAVDAEDRLQLAGCSAHDEVQGETWVRVELEHATRIGPLHFDSPAGTLALADALAAEVPDQGSADTEPALWVEQRRSDGELAPAGSRLRVRVIDPAGNVLPSFELTSDSQGLAELVAEIRFTGAFTVELASRWAPDGAGRQWVHGFATPAQRRIQPFADDEIYWSLPLRLGRQGAGYAALTRRGTGLPTLRFARAEIDAGGAVVFARTAAAPGVYLPVGRVYDNRIGEDEAALVLQPITDLQGALFDPELLLLHADARADRAVQIAFDSHAPEGSDAVRAALPVGPCDGRASAGGDVDAPPLALSFFPQRNSAGRLRAPLHLATLDGRVSPDLAACWSTETVSAMGSFCVADQNQSQHRLLVLRITDELDEEVSTQVIDLDAGLQPALLDRSLAQLCTFFDTQPRQELGLAQTLGAGLGNDDQPRLLSSAFSGFNLRLEVLRATAGPDEVLVRESVLADGLRAPAEALAGGAFAAAGRRDVVSLMTLRGVDEAEGTTFLSFLHQAGNWEGGAQFGGLVLGRCGQVQRLSSGLARASCWMYATDLDGDGRDELLTTRVSARTGVSGEVVRGEHQLYRFGSWWSAE